MADLTYLGDITPMVLTRPSPITVPELLQSIFTHLSPNILRFVVSLVCRFWHQVAQLVIKARPVVWMESSSEVGKALQGGVYQRLGLTNTLDLRIDYSVERTSLPRPSSWKRLIGTLDIISQKRQLKITHLLINRNLDHNLHLFPLLTLVAPTLTELKISGLCNDAKAIVPLDKILVLCPHLICLQLQYHSPSSYIDVHEQGIQPDLVLPTCLKLRSLTLDSIGFESVALIRLLGSCPSLEALFLINMHATRIPKDRIADFARATFVDRFSWYCRKVRRLHLSVSGSSIWCFRNVRSTIWMLKQFPHVREWSFRLMEGVDVIKALRKPSFDHLTSLKFTQSTGLYRGSLSSLAFGHALHKFMCRSPHLLHLKAPMVDFSIRWMDLEGILTPFGYTRARYLRSVQTFPTIHSIPAVPGSIHRTIWACRRLRTLHFSCFMGNDGSAENSRVLFGYLSRVCPQLQDLEFTRRCLTMQLEGGFCLLTRLHDLRRLKMVMWTEEQREKAPPSSSPSSSSALLSSLSPILSTVSLSSLMASVSLSSSPSPRYVEWIRMSITPKLQLQLLSQLEHGDSDSSWSRRQVHTRRPFKSLDPGKAAAASSKVSSGESMATQLKEDEHWAQEDEEGEMAEEWGDLDFMIDGVDMRNLGQWKDITDLFQDRLSTNWRCWPQLEYLEIQLSPPSYLPYQVMDVLKLMKKRIQKLRPEIEVV
ncbi:hypothetical protein BGX31_009920 [Mortierella sp. GBA43]|nr:hypothetical protein BGX31_009920 [Mortierella sp. GBA43]